MCFKCRIGWVDTTLPPNVFSLYLSKISRYRANKGKKKIDVHYCYINDNILCEYLREYITLNTHACHGINY